MKNTENLSGSSNSTENGFTLIELLASMVVFMVVMGSIYGVLQVARLSRGAVSNQAQLTKNVRLGLNLIGRDTYNAGFGYPLKNTVTLRDNRISTLLGVPVDIDTGRDKVPPIIAGDNVTLSTFSRTPNTRTDQVTFLFKDSFFNRIPNNNLGVSQSLGVTSGAIVGGAFEVTLSGGTNAACQPNDIFLLSGANGYTIGVATLLSNGNKVAFGTGDSLAVNNNNAATSEFLSIGAVTSIYRVKMVTYFVTADGTLTRREFANVPPPAPATAFVDEPLVHGVENFQLSYIMEDGTELANPSAGPDGVAGNADDDQTDLAAVRLIRVTITARTTEVDARGQPVLATETATFSTRNLGYDAN